MGDIHIGSNLDYHWLNGRSFSSVIQPLRKAGLTVLEIHLDLRFPEIAQHINFLCYETANAGLDISFHAPYLDPPSMYDFSNQHREKVKSNWQPVLEIVNR